MFILGLIFPQPEKYFWAFCIDVEKSCAAGKLAFCYFQSDLCSLAPAAFKSGIFLQFSLKTAAVACSGRLTGYSGMDYSNREYSKQEDFAGTAIIV